MKAGRSIRVTRRLEVSDEVATRAQAADRLYRFARENFGLGAPCSMSENVTAVCRSSRTQHSSR
jgi:hypothetical protein